MATQDWPTDRAFAAAIFRPGADVAKSGFTGFYTGNRETTSHLADRLTCEVSLPPCKSRADAARREAFFMGLVSTGDWVRFGMPHRTSPIGTMSGTVTVNGAVAAGARSVTLAGLRSQPNVLVGSSFEIDTNADGRADNWINYSSGSAGTVSYSRGSGAGNSTHGTYAQRINSTALGSTSSDRAGIYQSVTISAGAYSIASAAADVRGTTGVTAIVTAEMFDAGNVLLSAPSTSVVLGSFGFVLTRLALNGFSVPATAVRIDLYAWMQQGTGAAALLDVDAFQLEFASTSTAYSGYATAAPGDFIGIGGNLLQVSYAGATATDGGAMTVPLVYPVQEAISNGAAVTLTAPTGTWELDTDGLQLDYSAGNIQGGIAVPFRQVIV